MENKTINYTAYSEMNMDIDFVKKQGRLIGCRIGDPEIVFGRNVRCSEQNLQDKRNQMIREGYTITDVRRGSFSATAKIAESENKIMKKYKLKPQTIEAVQFDGTYESFESIKKELDSDFVDVKWKCNEENITSLVLEGIGLSKNFEVEINEFIVKDIDNGEYSVVNENAIDSLYEKQIEGPMPVDCFTDEKHGTIITGLPNPEIETIRNSFEALEKARKEFYSEPIVDTESLRNFVW